MTLPYGPPVPVSPLIRGLRFALLIAGIIYARGKQSMYNSMEAAYQEEEAKKKVLRDEHMAKVKAKIAAEEKETVRLFESGKLFEPGVMESISSSSGVCPPPRPCPPCDPPPPPCHTSLYPPSPCPPPPCSPTSSPPPCR